MLNLPYAELFSLPSFPSLRTLWDARKDAKGSAESSFAMWLTCLVCLSSLSMHRVKGLTWAAWCLSSFSRQFSQTWTDSQELQKPGAPVHTLSSLSTLEQIVRNLLSGTPQTANIPSRMRRSLTWETRKKSFTMSSSKRFRWVSLLSNFKHKRENLAVTLTPWETWAPGTLVFWWASYFPLQICGEKKNK